MKKKFFVLVFFLMSIYCSAQLINNKPVQLLIGSINFNPEEIKKNKIKSINSKVSNKPDGSVIVDKGVSFGYKFNTAGYVTNYYYTIYKTVTLEDAPPSKTSKLGVQNKYSNDTIFVEAVYDNLNRVVCKRTKTDNVYDAFYYDYNAQNQLIKETHYKETNSSQNKDEFKKGEQEFISSETYEYKAVIPTQTKIKSMNVPGHPYKINIVNYDKNKNLTSEYIEFTMGSLRQEYNYQYLPDSKMIKKTYSSNEKGGIKIEWLFEYGKNNNLTTEKKIKNNEPFFETNYLYDESGTLIKSEVNRDYKDASVLIARYSYEFY